MKQDVPQHAVQAIVDLKKTSASLKKLSALLQNASRSMGVSSQGRDIQDLFDKMLDDSSRMLIKMLEKCQKFLCRDYTALCGKVDYSTIKDIRFPFDTQIIEFDSIVEGENDMSHIIILLSTDFEALARYIDVGNIEKPKFWYRWLKKAESDKKWKESSYLGICVESETEPDTYDIVVKACVNHEVIMSKELHDAFELGHYYENRPAVPVKDYLASLNKDDIETVMMGLVFSSVLNFGALFSCINVQPEVVFKPKAYKKKGKPVVGKHEQYSYWSLVVDPKQPKQHVVNDGVADEHVTNPSHHKRQHVRRGHPRHLQSGKNVWVRSCVVGGNGLVDKIYVM